MPVPPLSSKPASKWPAPIQRWCSYVKIDVSFGEPSTIQKKLQSLLFCRSAFKTQANMSCSNASYWLMRISLSNGHTLISKAIYGAIIWANTVHVTENPLMMMHSGYCWLQPDTGWWVRAKTLALQLCGFFFVNKSGFRKSSSKIRRKEKLEVSLGKEVGKWGGKKRRRKKKT